MKLLIIAIFLLGQFDLFAEPIIATKTYPRFSDPVVLPEHPIHRPVRPVVPITINPGVVYQDNYYNHNVVNSCQSYMDQITKLNQEIADLKREVERLRAIEAAHLQKKLKAEHQKDMNAFENRKSSIKSKNSIKITDK